MQLIGVPAPAVWDYWGPIQGLVASAIDRGRGTVKAKDILDKLLQKKMQLWVAKSGREICAICITEILVYPQRKSCMIYLVAGQEMDKWMHLLEPITVWAKGEGCDFLEANGRRGWEKVLRDWKVTGVNLLRPI